MFLAPDSRTTQYRLSSIWPISIDEWRAISYHLLSDTGESTSPKPVKYSHTIYPNLFSNFRVNSSEVACDPYIEAIQYLNSTNIDVNVLQSIVFLLMVKLWTVILEQLVAIILFRTKIEITLARKYDLVRSWFSEVAF